MARLRGRAPAAAAPDAPTPAAQSPEAGGDDELPAAVGTTREEEPEKVEEERPQVDETNPEQAQEEPATETPPPENLRWKNPVGAKVCIRIDRYPDIRYTSTIFPLSISTGLRSSHYLYLPDCKSHYPARQPDIRLLARLHRYRSLRPLTTSETARLRDSYLSVRRVWQ